MNDDKEHWERKFITNLRNTNMRFPKVLELFSGFSAYIC